MKKENYNMKTKPVKRCREDVIFDTVIFIILTLILFVVAYPLYWVIISSFSDPTAVSAGKVLLRPMGFTLKGYAEVFKNSQVMRGFFNSIVITFVGVCVNLAVTLPTAYALSRDNFSGKKPITVFYMITMFFGGGMIPTFILVNNLHMVNTVWAILLPGAFNVWNMILARTYFQSIPAELREASELDGATEIQHFFKIMLPVCKPIIAVLALWSFVGMWNSYFDAMIYLNDADMQPLQLVLRSILVQNTPQPGMIADIQSTAEMAKVAELLKYATIVVSSLPLLIMYPFFQKYFDKGIMVGSVKG